MKIALAILLFAFALATLALAFVLRPHPAHTQRSELPLLSRSGVGGP
jgi:hypothetical protein